MSFNKLKAGTLVHPQDKFHPCYEHVLITGELLQDLAYPSGYAQRAYCVQCNRAYYDNAVQWVEIHATMLYAAEQAAKGLKQVSAAANRAAAWIEIFGGILGGTAYYDGAKTDDDELSA